jgi:iron complex transport system ATP-binding protein
LSINRINISGLKNRLGLPILSEFELRRGNVLCVMGPNGCGKSTLLKSILGLLGLQWDRYQMGKKDCSLNDVHRKLTIYFGYLAQNTTIPFGMRVDEYLSLFENENVLQANLTNFSVLELESKLASNLSGGEWQRILLYKTFRSMKYFYILDEPFSFLDGYYQNELVQIVRSRREQCGFLIVVHDLDWVFKLNADLLLLDGLNQGDYFSFQDLNSGIEERASKPWTAFVNRFEDVFKHKVSMYVNLKDGSKRVVFS